MAADKGEVAGKFCGERPHAFAEVIPNSEIGGKVSVFISFTWIRCNLHLHHLRLLALPLLHLAVAFTSRYSMDFPVSFNIEQLGLSECLFEEFKAAEILEQHGYRACIVGDAASVVYGSDLVIGDIFMAIADEQLQPAFQMLLGRGFLEEPQTNLRFMPVSDTPMKDSSSGWPGHRLRRQVPKHATKGILLIPATFWHLDLGENRFSSDTLLFPRSMCRFPRLEPYLNGTIKIPRFYLSSHVTKSYSFNLHHNRTVTRRPTQSLSHPLHSVPICCDAESPSCSLALPATDRKSILYQFLWENASAPEQNQNFLVVADGTRWFTQH
jgi:hypothetical protein